MERKKDFGHGQRHNVALPVRWMLVGEGKERLAANE
jgi:hypothetical protein